MPSFAPAPFPHAGEPLTPQAFIKLESLPSIPAEKQEAYGDLAMSIFLKNPPADPRSLRETAAKKSSKNPAMDALLEDLGGAKEQVCRGVCW